MGASTAASTGRPGIDLSRPIQLAGDTRVEVPSADTLQIRTLAGNSQLSVTAAGSIETIEGGLGVSGASRLTVGTARELALAVGGQAIVAIENVDALKSQSALGIAGEARLSVGAVNGPTDLKMAGYAKVRVGRALDDAQATVGGGASFAVTDFRGKHLDLDVGGEAKVAIIGNRNRAEAADLDSTGFADNITVGGKARIYVQSTQLANIDVAGEAQLRIGQIHGPTTIDVAGEGLVVIEARPTSEVQLKIMGRGSVRIGEQTYTQSTKIDPISTERLLAEL